MASHSGEKSKVDQVLQATFAGNLERIKKLGKEIDDGKGLSETLADVKDSVGRGLLHIAALKGGTNVCKYLLEELKFNVNDEDDEDSAPLLHAIFGGHLSTVVYLLENGADPAALNKHNSTALHIASSQGNIKMIHLFLSKSVDVNAPSEFGTPLQLAAQYCKQDVLKLLLDRGANPNFFDNLTPSPLEWSMIRRSLPCLRLLIQAGADPNGIACVRTPLSFAARGGEIKFIKCLLEAGADPNIVDDTGEKPLEIAARKGKLRTVGILFPVTSPIPACSNWSITGIMKYVHSEEARRKIALRLKEKHLKAKSKGEDAQERKDYLQASLHYTEAIAVVRSNATVFAQRSLCMACLGDGDSAWSDAKACILLRPDWPEAYYRAGIALSLLQKFDMATDAFLSGLKLDPENKELQDGFRKSVEARMNSVRI